MTEDIAFRVLAGNATPDHVTIARFRVRHEQALAGLLVASLKLCAAAGMVRLGLVALDGTKIEANAAAAANRTHATLEAQVAELLSQAAEADQREDLQHGDARGDELPRALAGRAERLARLQHAKAPRRPRRPPASSATGSGSPNWPLPPGRGASDPGPTCDHGGAMRPPTPRRPSTPPTLTAGSCVAAGAPAGLQRPGGCHPRAGRGRRRADPAGQRRPATGPDADGHPHTLAAAGIGDPVQRLAADFGYWSIANVSAIHGAPELLIPPARHGRHGKPRKDGKPSASKSDSLRAVMLARIGSEQGKACYAQRSRTIEPVFGQVKTVQGGGRFMRRGLRACQAEWKLLCGTHNLLKLWRTTTATTS